MVSGGIRDRIFLFWKKLGREEYISAIGLLIIVILLWIPFSLKTSDIADGWINLPLVEGKSLVSMVSRVFSATSRPLVYVPWKLGSMLTRDSFIGVQLLFALSFFGKSLAFYAILRKMRLASPALAFLMAILFILYPADQGNFLMAAFGRHVAVFFYLLATLLLILASQRSNLFFFIGMILAECISALISEQGFPLILFTPIVLLLIKECPKRKKIALAAGWYTIFVLVVVNYVMARKSYQVRLLDNETIGDRAKWVEEIILSNLVAYKRIFFDGWRIAFSTLQNPHIVYILLAFAITLIVGLMVFLLARTAKDGEENNTRRYFWVMVLAGLAIIGLSFFPYSITSDRYKDYRVFYYSAAGAALVVGVIFSRVMQWLPRWKKVVGGLLWGLTIFLISLGGLEQHALYVIRSEFQQKVLVNIVEQAPYVRPGTVIVLMTENKDQVGSAEPYIAIAGFVNNDPFKSDIHFTTAMNWIYGNKSRLIQAVECGNLRICEFIPFKRAIIFGYTEDHGAVLLEQVPVEYQQEEGAEDYHPYGRIKSYVPFPTRAQKAFEVTPEPSRLVPAGWDSQEQTLNDRRVCNAAHSGNCALLFYDDGTLTTFSQKFQVSGNANEQIKLSLWGRAELPPPSDIPIAYLTVFYNDGTKDVHNITGRLGEKWSFYIITFETVGSYSQMLLQLRPNTDLGMIWLDDVRLVGGRSKITIVNPSFEE